MSLLARRDALRLGFVATAIHGVALCSPCALRAQETAQAQVSGLRWRGAPSGVKISPSAAPIMLRDLALTAGSGPEQEAWARVEEAERVLNTRADGSGVNRLEQALAEANEAVAIAQENSLIGAEAAATNVLGQIALNSGRAGQLEPMRHFQAAARLALQAGDEQLAVRAIINAARGEARLPAPDRDGFDPAAIQRAIRYLDNVADWMAQDADAYTATAWAQSWVDILAGSNELAPARALEAIQLAHEAATQAGDTRLVSWNLGLMGQVYALTASRLNKAGGSAKAAGYEDTALGLFRKSGQLAESERAPEIAYHAQWRAGEILYGRGELDEAIAAYRVALSNVERTRLSLPEYDPQTGESLFRRTLGPIYTRLADLELRRFRESGAQNGELRPAPLRHAQTVVEQLKAAELDDYFGDACTAALLQQAVSLDEFGSPGVAVLYPVLLDDRTELILTMPDGALRSVESPFSREYIENAAVRLRETIDPDYFEDHEGADYFEFKVHAEQLYKALIAPIQEQLEGIHTIVFVPDGQLRNIPLGVLINNERFLIDDFAIGTTAGLLLLGSDVTDRDKASLMFGGTAKKVPLPANTAEVFEELPGVTTERDDIVAKYQESAVLLDEEFTLDAIERIISERSFDIVHVAAHGEFGDSPSNSYILAWDDRLLMSRLETLLSRTRFRERPIDLLTLSACQTAKGNDRAALGIAGLAVKVGARSAIAALWNALDQTTPTIMGTFYDELRAGQSKAQALRLGQLRVSNNDLGHLTAADRNQLDDFIDPVSGRLHPAAWSPFIVVGSWV